MKKYDDNRRYSVRKTLRITPAQWQMIQERMARVRLKDFNRYARQMLIDGYFFVIDDKEEIKAMTYEINKIGTNINQIAYKLNLTGTASEEDIREIKALMAAIWDLQRELLIQDDFCTKYLRSTE
jgi:alkyl hydroperoxide reductase subunit AhpC